MGVSHVLPSFSLLALSWANRSFRGVSSHSLASAVPLLLSASPRALPGRGSPPLDSPTALSQKSPRGIRQGERCPVHLRLHRDAEGHSGGLPPRSDRREMYTYSRLFGTTLRTHRVRLRLSPRVEYPDLGKLTTVLRYPVTRSCKTVTNSRGKRREEPLLERSGMDWMCRAERKEGSKEKPSFRAYHATQIPGPSVQSLAIRGTQATASLHER